MKGSGFRVEVARNNRALLTSWVLGERELPYSRAIGYYREHAGTCVASEKS